MNDTAAFNAPHGPDARLGLALSGGGFRAALFHVGILAQLAERDLLRRVSVISTVSGGSIIGAFYFIKVKQLLEGRRDDDMQPDAAGFKKLVHELEREFLEAVQRNIRVSALLDRHKNARMLGTAYSTTQRLAELFDEHFYRPVNAGNICRLQDLLIRPHPDLGEPGAQMGGFEVPRLVLNATALNTGRLWQFSDEFVGESEAVVLSKGATPLPVLGRLSMREQNLSATQRARLNGLTLGQAVASSCCVPGLLEPFSLTGLFRDADGEDIDVRLVDGGVCDNQGLVSLFDQGCTHILCSDATDLLQWQPGGAQRTVEVVVRANEIMMDRIRGELLDELHQRYDGRFALFNLADEDASRVFPVDSQRIAHALARIRTDLDAFSDIEAASLMYFGYAMSGEKFEPGSSQQLLRSEAEPGEWQFLSIRERLDQSGERAQLMRLLEVGSRQFLKVFYLGKYLPYVIVLAPLTLPLALIGVVIYYLPPVPTSAWVVLGLIVATGVAYSKNNEIVQLMDQVPVLRRMRLRLAATLRPLGVPALFGLFGASWAWIQLSIFNRLFLKYGRLLANPRGRRWRAKRRDGSRSPE